jgi:L-ascorbate metabolism protein UlaG (beta-lactamase superfamily)
MNFKFFKRKSVQILFGVIILLVGYGFWFLRQPQFGKLPDGERLARIKKSPNYRDGKFQNISYTPDIKEGVSNWIVTKDYFFKKSERNEPSSKIPSKKTDLLTLSPEEDILVWMGHASYFMQVDGKKILVDPVFSGNASPTRLVPIKSYDGTDIYTVDDLPEIDYLFISGDHYDHLDYETILQLEPKVKKVIVGLGVGAHFEHWGYQKDKILEKDWNEEEELNLGFVINTVSARHFSGRGLKRDQSLWLSFVLTTPTMRIFIGGESAYDTHFASIGKNYGPFDIAILECGQYNEYWKYVHMMPEETVQAALDLRAKVFLPVHWAKFSLAMHAWDNPIIRATAESKKKNIPIATPMIGEKLNLKDTIRFNAWWLMVK